MQSEHFHAVLLLWRRLVRQVSGALGKTPDESQL